MANKKISNTFMVFCIFGISFSVAAESDPAIKTLLDQAGYWHAKAHDDLAATALKKILKVDPTNIDALYLMALYALQSGDKSAAESWRQKIIAIAPDDPRLASLHSEETMLAISPSELAMARDLAKQGKVKQAVAAYRRIFNNGQPAVSLANEYYLTLAGDRDSLPEAIAGLRQQARIKPNDRPTRLALAKTLTYQIATRREGIKMLTDMGAADKQADAALLQALLWYQPQPEDLPLYSAYAKSHPTDTQVMAHYRDGMAGAEKTHAFDALNHGQLADAKSAFLKVLDATPKDGDALAGLGLVAMRSGQFDDAVKNLRLAVEAGGKNSAQWQQLADDAHFYGLLNQGKNLARNGNPAAALALVSSLPDEHNAKGLALNMFKADMMRRTGNLSSAEELYRQMDRQRPHDTAIRSGLFFVLQQQHKTQEAAQVLNTLPASLRTKYNQQDGSTPLRQAAAQAIQQGHDAQAMEILQRGINQSPNNIWIKLDLARLLTAQGQNARAASLMAQAVQKPSVPADSLFACALFAAENNNWSTAQALLTRISPGEQTPEMRSLNQRVRFNRQLAIADGFIRQGNSIAALNTLHIMAANPPDNPADLGNLAQKIMQAGDSTTALRLVKLNIAKGLHGSVSDYAAQTSVLNQAGLFAQAQAILNDPSLQSQSTAEEIAKVRSGSIIPQADKLREQGHVAAAYGLLMTALHDDPKNEDLLLAMARVYLSDHMYSKADEIYAFLLRHNAHNQQAIEGAINAALAENNATTAQRLLTGLTPSRKPDYLLLCARVAQAAGKTQQAIALLRTAKWRLQGTDSTGVQMAQSSAVGATGISAIDDASLPSTTASNGFANTNDPTGQAIDRMLTDLQDKTAGWVQTGIAVRHRNGDAGTSQLSEVTAPLTLSIVPGDSGRLQVTLTPTTEAAGALSSLSANSFGTGALVHAQRRAAAGITTTAAANANADAADSHMTTGLETDIRWSDDNYAIDAGSTLLGQANASWVGGLEWRPQITEFSNLNIKAERRAVKDSVLSYAGATDKTTGIRWGAVTKNGGSLQYAYDDGGVGMYGGVGYYDYTGENIPTNNEFTASAGMYVRPYRTADTELKTGVDISYMTFSKNLSQFTLGQGGYFSPQDYISISLPVTWTKTYEKLTLALNAALGFQSYNQDQSDYFPGHSTLQTRLENYASTDDQITAVYKSSTKSGINYTAGLDAKYQINDNTTIDANLGYNTFGDYSEGAAGITMKWYINQK
ncbi:cellulose synthase subunit BcsC-related outer membrane protein [Acerihabitans sp. TG2]|uniref:cellulose synthase subunit BcsC-related outer membrane protein n=1 Tax=Acerihabitans sp. TG2 TaxID=3096008 RepID=UPI002B234215|nr:cellulose synthase subunit BcsC-related outer membrane protein [Acerihabitans sp. TG2]MEA9389006.1 cellulose synthase subunit BcsC-related outer membrane protein [Acerihabitans sp. TG2]